MKSASEPLSSIKVSLILRSPVLRAAFASLISTQDGVSIHSEFGSFEEAAQGLEDPPDLIICGANKTGFHPASLVSTLQETSGQTVPVLVLTTRANHDPELVRTSLGAGVTGFVSLGLNLDSLVYAIRAVVSGLTVLGQEAHLAVFATSNPSNELPHALTARERDVLDLMVSGQSNKEIADRLGVGMRTVEAHVAHILEKTGSHSRTEAVIKVLTLQFEQRNGNERSTRESTPRRTAV